MNKSGEPFGPRSRAAHRTLLRGFGLSASIAFALSGCGQSWPKDSDVYHRQIIMPDEVANHGLYYMNEKTGKPEPEVCDTYGSGLTVCSPGSFDKAPPIKQFRAKLAKH